MLSILIPVYNFNITRLVHELHRQAVKTSVPFEIIVLDDCSSELLRDRNRGVSSLPAVIFRELETNVGRATIRNQLASMSKYSSLLFMDCDTEIPDEQFIERYLPYCGKDLVVCGGRIYKSEPPDDPEYSLRWFYGINREQLSAKVRSINPYKSFMTNNFLISKSILQMVHFDETITQYGHEDTLFGLELQKRQIPVVHIQNPLYHIGLEVASDYIRKTNEGIKNLVTLINTGKINLKSFRNIRLLNAYLTIRKFHLTRFYLYCYKNIANNVMRNLLGGEPSLFLFDLYKLNLFIRLMRR